MKLNKLLCLAVILLATNVQAQDLKVLVNEKGKVGYADSNGNEIIKCQYESALPFSNGTAIVTKSGKSGIIDTAGNVLLPLKYNQIQVWNDGLYLIKNGKKMGLADHKGQIVLPVNYSHISKPNVYGKAWIALGGKATPNDKKIYMANAKYGIIDSKGNILVTPKYKGLYEFSFNGKNVYPYYEGQRLEFTYHNTVDTLLTDCSFLGFSGNGFNIYNAGIMDGNGKELLKAGLYYFVMQPQNNMVRYYTTKKKQTLCGYHNLSTDQGFQVAAFEQTIGSFKFWTHGDFIGDIAPVNGSSWSFIDKTGKVLRSGYQSLKHNQTTGLWAAKNNSGKWDVFNDSNSDITELSGFDDINFPTNNDDKELFSVSKDGKYGCITRNGEIVVPFEYEQILGNRYDILAVKKNGKWGMISANNTLLIPTEYADLILPTERNTKHIWVIKSDSLYYHMNLTNNRLSTKGYKTVTNFKDGIAHVTPTGMKVENNQLNRAQIYAPNTPKSTIDAVDMTKYIQSFGILIDTNDMVLIDYPISKMYKEDVVKEIRKRGNRALTDMEKKTILLNVTRENRSYDLKATLNEDEWNY